MGSNVFVYCCNNPIKYIDSLGKRPIAYNEGNRESEDTRVWSLSYMNNKKVDLTYKLTTFMEEKAKEMEQYYHTHSLLKSALYFKNNVTDDGIWDIKLQDDWTFERGNAYYFNGQQLRYDDTGNINFGYVGAVLFAELILCAGAGANQIKKYGFQFGDLSTFYDDPRDNQMVKYGYQLYMRAH